MENKTCFLFFNKKKRFHPSPPLPSEERQPARPQSTATSSRSPRGSAGASAAKVAKRLGVGWKGTSAVKRGLDLDF